MLRYYVNVIFRPLKFTRLINNIEDIKIYYGCGDISQPGYINVDLRYTNSVDIVADLAWCSKNFHGRCSEVYLSHVLEHYGYPGRDRRTEGDTVLNALSQVYAMLRPGGVVRIAVPDFARLCSLYQSKALPLYPRISGRICGEQDYRENVHRCVFDREFLEKCLLDMNFVRVSEWDAFESGLNKDSSFDTLNGVPTSLNLIAVKPEV
jgi:predicted SAM-dependent methyltransferase